MYGHVGACGVKWSLCRVYASTYSTYVMNRLRSILENCDKTAAL